MTDNELDTKACILEAVEMLPEGDQPVVSDGADDFALYIRILAEHMLERELITTDDKARAFQLIEQALLNAQTDPNTTGTFYHTIVETADESSDSSYVVSFPLNIDPSRGEAPPKTIESNETLVRNISLADLKEQIQDAQLQVEDSNHYESLPEWLTPDCEVFDDDTIYQAEVESQTAELAVRKLQRDVSLIVGKLDFTHMEPDPPRMSLNELRSQERDTLPIIRRPPLYLIFQNGDYETHTTTDSTLERTSVSLRNGFNADFDQIRRFPPGDHSWCDSELSNSIRALRAGLEAQQNERAFLYFWRGLEEITLHDDSDSSKDALERSLPLVHDHFNIPLLQSLIERIANKRNGIVHDGGESPVYNSDVNLLRKLLYHSIVEMFELRDDYTRQETIGILNYGLVDKANIKDKKEKHDENLDDTEKKITQATGAAKWQTERASFEDADTFTRFTTN